MPNVTATPVSERDDDEVLQRTYFIGLANIASNSYTYPTTQEILIIRNRSDTDFITVTVNSASYVIPKGGSRQITASFTTFDITSTSNSQAFDATAIKAITRVGTGGGSGVLIVSTVAELLSSYPNGSAAPVWVTADNSWYYWSGALPTPDTTPPTVSISPTPGTFTSAQSVTLTANEAATIYYTLDGSTPTTSSMAYSSAISVNSTVTLKYFARDTAGNSSAVQTASYTIDAGAPPDTTAPNPVTGLSAGTPTANSVPLTWTISNSGDVTKQEIAYSTDGTNFTVANGNVNPSTNSATVTGLAASTAYTFRLVAIDGANNRSTAVTTTATTGVASVGKVNDASLLIYQDNPTLNQTIANPDTYFHNADQFTAFATVQPISATNSAASIFTRLSPNAVNFSFTFDSKVSGILTGKNANGTGSANFPQATSAPTTYTDHSVPYHVVFMRDSTSIKVYVNNVLLQSTNVASDFYVDTSTSPLMFASSVQAGVTFKNMGYYNRALTTAELTQNYNALK